MNGLTDILDKLLEESEGQEQMQMKHVLEAFSGRSYGALLLAPALISLLPTGAIPTVPSLCGIFISLIAIQAIFGRQHPWLPNWITERSIDRDRIVYIGDKAKPWTRWMDSFLYERLPFLTGVIATRLVALLSIVLGLSMIPLELVPFACAIPGGAVAFFALGLWARDGLLMLVGLIGTVVTAAALYYFWPF